MNSSDGNDSKDVLWDITGKATSHWKGAVGFFGVMCSGLSGGCLLSAHALV